MSVSTLIQSTGEVIDFASSTPEDVINSYRLVNDYLEAYTAIKKQLQDLTRDIVDERGTYEHDGYLLRVSSVQRQQYDKAVMRQVFDEDLMDLMLEPAKGRVDKYIREHLEELGESATLLRSTMVAAGKPYGVVKLERIG